jgi:putative endonuclease
VGAGNPGLVHRSAVKRVINRHPHQRASMAMTKTTSTNTQYCVYIMTNKSNKVLYTGVTNDLKRRIYEHKEKLVDGFTRKYNINKLVYYEVFENIDGAIVREKQIKSGSRQKKIVLINSMNKEWRELYEEL